VSTTLPIFSVKLRLVLAVHRFILKTGCIPREDEDESDAIPYLTC
jgi:hypothetical protein